MTKVTQAHIDARTEEILGAAMKTFACKGVVDTTMQEIAAEAGLSAGAIYRYYPSKEHLLRAVFADCTQQSQATFQQAVARTDSPCEAIGDVGRAAWAKLKSEGFQEELILSLESTLAAVRQQEELGAERREMLNALIEMLEGLIQQAQAAGEIDTGVDSRALASTLLACHLGSGLLLLQLGDSVDTDAVFSILMRMLPGLAPQAT
jgi:AcrR family transcriptional regulator